MKLQTKHLNQIIVIVDIRFETFTLNRSFNSIFT